MKKLLAIAMMCVTVMASAQTSGTKKVSILGDSYSTFQNWNPAGQAPFYPNDRNDVKEPEQTWWMLYIKAMGYELEKNDSWGGTTVCTTGYGRMNVARNSFLARTDSLGSPDILFVFGGTNDAWANSPIGEYKYADWTDEDLKSYRPALACLLTRLKTRYPEAKIVALLNSELKEEINESTRTVCRECGIQLVELQDVEKQNGHPSIKGMESISRQLQEQVKF